MKSEEFIDKYMESDLWENPYHKKEYMEEYYPAKPPPGVDPVDPTQWDKDRKTWLNLKGRIITDPITLTGLRRWSYDDYEEGYVTGGYDVEGQDAYRFIRKVIDKATNPYGGYLYRRLHYLGYNQTMGVLIPSGFEVDNELTHLGNIGGRVPQQYQTKRFMELMRTLGLWKTSRPLENRGTKTDYYQLGSPYFDKDMIRERYIFIYSDYLDFPNYWVDDVVNAIIGDLYFLRIRKQVDGIYKSFTNSRVSDPIPDIFNEMGRKGFKAAWPKGEYYAIHRTDKTFITQKPYMKTIATLGFLISEAMLLIKYIKRLGSVIPWPIFPNFGFKGTMPQALIDKNIGCVVDLLDNVFNTHSLSTQKQKWGSKIDAGTGSDPLLTYINGGSDPPPSGGGGDDPIDVWAGKVGE